MSVSNVSHTAFHNTPLDHSGVVAYECSVMHKRLRPFTYDFRYSVMSICVDIDTFDRNHENTSWLGYNSSALMSLYTKDFGSRDGSDWRIWLTTLLQEYGVTTSPARIVLACMPRCLGVEFNPLAMWYSYNEHDEIIAVVAEVSNTFGHFHHYVCTNDGEPLHCNTTSGTTVMNLTAPKIFHVSPFMGMECRYHFSLTLPSTKQQALYRVMIRETENGADTLIASQTGKPVDAPYQGFGVTQIGYLLTSIKTIVAIHWWALKIVCKGGKFRSTPQKQRKKTYGHSRMDIE